MSFAVAVLALAALLLAAVQDAVLHMNLDDLLHRFAELEVGAKGVLAEYVVEVSGTLSIWASSEETDPRRTVEAPGGEGRVADDDSGGDTTAWLQIAIRPDAELSVTNEAWSHVVESFEDTLPAKDPESCRPCESLAAVSSDLGELERSRSRRAWLRTRGGSEHGRAARPTARGRGWGDRCGTPEQTDGRCS